jgi:hypothetical protein
VRDGNRFGGGTVRVPTDTGEAKAWAILLGLDEVLPSCRVAIIHFFEVDIIVKPDFDGLCVFDGIDRAGPTKYQVTDTRNGNTISPARPAAPKASIINSIFHGTGQMIYSVYLQHAEGRARLKKSATLKSNLKRKERISASSEDFTSPTDLFSPFLDSSTESCKAGRKPEKPYQENFLGTLSPCTVRTLYVHRTLRLFSYISG